MLLIASLEIHLKLYNNHIKETCEAVLTRSLLFEKTTKSECNELCELEHGFSEI